MTDMLETAQSPKTRYLAALDRQSAASQPEWLRQIRRAAAARFAELEFPNRRQEDWRFTNVAPITSTAFQPLAAAKQTVTDATLQDVLFREPDWTELVFVNGFFAPDLSTVGRLSDGTIAGSLAAGISDGVAIIEEHCGADRSDGNIFTALNSGLFLDGAFVYVPPEGILKAPIHIVHVTAGTGEPAVTLPRNLIVVERGAQAEFIESYVNLSVGATCFTNVVTELILQSGARANWHTLVRESDSGYHVATTNVTQAHNSHFRSCAVTLTGRIVRNELSTVLNGDGAEASLNGLYLTRGEQLVDNAIAIEHAKPHCASWINYKGVLDDTSSAVFSGKIHVRRNAQKTDSKQLNRNLLLSDKATVNTKPLLRIFADDVKCTHGATVGQHPEEVIFYFRSRGMSEAMARAMLTYGFADEIINQIEIPPLRRRLDRTVYARYSPILA